MTKLSAFHLPVGARPVVVGSPVQTTPISHEMAVDHPAPTTTLIHAVCDSLEAAAAPSQARGASSRIAALGQAGARFLDPVDPLRVEALEHLPATAGISSAMAVEVLDGMARDWTPDRITAMVRSEFPDPAVLDGFRAGAGGTRIRAMAHRLVLQIGAGNVPGVSVGGAIRALLLGSSVLLKPGLHDTLLPVLYARALADVDPVLAEALGVLYWPGGSRAAEDAALARAGVVVAYGGSETLGTLRSRLPIGTGLVAYPHRVSVAVVGRAALTREASDEVALAAARAVSTFDQRGCVSPHVIWVEEGGEVSPAEWAKRLAEGMAAVEREWPAGSSDPETAAALHQLRGTWQMKEASGGGARVLAAKGLEWTVAYDPDPAFAASCLGRFVWVKPLTDLSRVGELTEGLGSLLQTVGIAGLGTREEALAEELGRAGATRVAPLERMAWPPPWWHHDGDGPLRSLVRWVDWEGV